MKRANPARLPGHAIADDGDNLQEIGFIKPGAVQYWHVTDIRLATSGISVSITFSTDVGVEIWSPKSIIREYRRQHHGPSQ